MMLVYDAKGISKEAPFTLTQLQWESVLHDPADDFVATEEELALAEENAQWLKDRDAKRAAQKETTNV